MDNSNITISDLEVAVKDLVSHSPVEIEENLEKIGRLSFEISC